MLADTPAALGRRAGPAALAAAVAGGGVYYASSGYSASQVLGFWGGVAGFGDLGWMAGPRKGLYHVTASSQARACMQT